MEKHLFFMELDGEEELNIGGGNLPQIKVNVVETLTCDISKKRPIYERPVVQPVKY